jgi:hypothetical protein
MEMTTIALLVLVPLLVWRIYSRLKRMLARQESMLWRHWLSAIAFPVLLGWLALSMLNNVLGLSCLAGGALAGVWLGVFGLKGTRFETQGRRYFFTPNLRIGLAVFMLFAARILYRGLELYMVSRVETPNLMSQTEFVQSPATASLIGLLAGYCASFSIGMLRWRRSQKPLPTPADTQ